MFSGFREFIMRGNVVDLAVAVVIGTAFGAVITSFVTDILTPLLGVFGLPNFEELSFTVGNATVNYGLFLNALLAFLLIAAAIYFFVVAPLNALEERRQRGAEETPTTKTCTECASEIPFVARRCPMCTQPQLSA
ncbi:MAG TPA: large conductance mechanosensitive channel protein MscL [Candidatus Limnocylindria bacterium]|nr:large conductance mechanosensitive channel protein MscL [Candidatus Limnocylindria bacterium]